MNFHTTSSSDIDADGVSFGTTSSIDYSSSLEPAIPMESHNQSIPSSSTTFVPPVVQNRAKLTVRLGGRIEMAGISNGMFGCSGTSDEASDDYQGSRKRSNRDDSVDDILSQICSKMTSLSTSDSNSSREEMIAAFISVLDCTFEEAEFFLESSVWNIEGAVHLWFDTGKGDGKRFRRPNEPKVHPPYFHPVPTFRCIEVKIEGLTEDWTAWVNAENGTIDFVHVPTGHTQKSVPPGFADGTLNPSIATYGGFGLTLGSSFGLCASSTTASSSGDISSTLGEADIHTNSCNSGDTDMYTDEAPPSALLFDSTNQSPLSNTEHIGGDGEAI